jgi:hypothetical protein
MALDLAIDCCRAMVECAAEYEMGAFNDFT